MEQLPIQLPESKYVSNLYEQPKQATLIGEIQNTDLQPIDPATPIPAIKTHLTANQYPKKGEVFTEPSQTIPDQSMSVREIMQRYAQGLPISGQKVPVWHGEDEFVPDFERMDKADIAMYKQQVNLQILDLREAAIIEAEEAKKQKQEDLIKKIKEQKSETVVHADDQPNKDDIPK